MDSNASELEKEQIDILNSQRRMMQKISPELTPLFNHFIKSNKGGKKIRGFLIRLGFELAGGKNKEILKIAAAYEILHTSILAHDDIIDKSTTRRRQTSLHKRVGVEQAITLADYGFFLAMQIISEAKFAQNLKNKALNLFSKIMVDTAIGQMLDVFHADPFTIMKLKTAQYTIAGPLQIGATLGGAGGKLLGQLGRFGENLGIAFQIQDDILDGEVDSPDDAKARAAQYTLKAKKMIPKIASFGRMRRLLEQMSQFMVERNL